MSSSYFIYTEIKINDIWHCIDGYSIDKNLYHTYSNHSRSYFGNTYDKMREIGNYTKFSDLSQEIREANPKLKYDLFEKGGREARYVTVDLKAFMDTVPAGFQWHGVVHKDMLEKYKNGEIEDLYTEDEINFSKMMPLEQKCYEYYEWDDNSSWQYYFKKLKNIINCTIEKFYDNNLLLDEFLPCRIVVFCL